MDRGWVGPELPSLGAVVLGTILFMSGGMLMWTASGTPVGIVLFAIDLGLLLRPQERRQ